jgi:hypothetical protein
VVSHGAAERSAQLTGRRHPCHGPRHIARLTRRTYDRFNPPIFKRNREGAVSTHAATYAISTNVEADLETKRNGIPAQSGSPGWRDVGYCVAPNAITNRRLPALRIAEPSAGIPDSGGTTMRR